MNEERHRAHSGRIVFCRVEASGTNEGHENAGVIEGVSTGACIVMVLLLVALFSW